MLFDFHVHMGQYFDDYYTPPRILRTLRLAGITHFAYSSTSTVVTDDAGFLQEERIAMHELSNGRAKPILWVTHDMLKMSRDLSLYMNDAGGEIVGLKVHGVSEPWEPFGKDLKRAFDIAKEYKIFVMLHTGEHEECEAEIYRRVCKAYSEVPVVLAHGRPLLQSIQMLKEYPNTYVDTSFMPHEHLRLLLESAQKNGFTGRILFGTDTPIPERHLKSSLPRHLRARIATSKQIAGKDWKKISWDNANRLLQGMIRQAHQPTPPQ